MDDKKKKKKRNKKNKNKQIKSREEDSDQSSKASNSQIINNAELDQELNSHPRNDDLSGTLEEIIKQLRDECDSHPKKEVSLEEHILKLRQINDSHLQKEVDSEMTIFELHNEKELLRQEKAMLVEKINQMVEDKAALDLKGANLEEYIKELEKEKESWILTENSSKETISILNHDITRLKMQVVELQESQSKLLQENQELADPASHQHLHIQNLERNITSSPRSDEVKEQASLEELYSQIESASVLVDKLIRENTELVDKVNELSVKLERQSKATANSTVIEISDSAPQTIDNGSISAPKLDSLKTAPINEGKTDGMNVDGQPTAPPPLFFVQAEGKIDGINADGQPAGPSPVFVKAEDSGEIVQISVDDTDARDFRSRSIVNENNIVPLTDAPLIGAPFRFISFVANYISGADLVKTLQARTL